MVQLYLYFFYSLGVRHNLHVTEPIFFSAFQDFFSQIVYCGKLELEVCLGSLLTHVLFHIFSCGLSIYLADESNEPIPYMIYLCTPFHCLQEPHYYLLVNTHNSLSYSNVGTTMVLYILLLVSFNVLRLISSLLDHKHDQTY